MNKLELTQKESLKMLLYLHRYRSKGLTQEEIAHALNLDVDNIRSLISVLRNKHMEEIIDTTFTNPKTGFSKKRYRYTTKMSEFKEWRLKNRDRSEGHKLGRPMY
jgi:orotate phosphoribosyltransferase-like protein